MKIKEIVQYLESIAPSSYQESYDNAGLITGNQSWECTGILTTLDCTEDIVKEAIAKNINMIVAHHPIVFKGLKKINGKNYVEQTIIAAIKNDIAIYAIHTNLDNVIDGVNARIADILGLVNRKILVPKSGELCKLVTFVPNDHSENVRNALFKAGAGNIGNYDQCSFNTEGHGTFKASEGTKPFVGHIGERHVEPETRIEVIFPKYLKGKVVAALISAHPYEEVAYDIYLLENDYAQVGAGLVGELPEALTEVDFLNLLKDRFQLQVIRHTQLLGKKIKKVALCGGAGSFLTGAAIASGSDIYVTGDVKYHEFFDADNKIVLADIGHFESEQFTIDLLFDYLRTKFPTFAVLKSDTKTNPIYYFVQ
ncbi:MAG: Nif3-like dinuclear metal center hexameric protein [Pseudopedobacter saltans]|uniref:GTP cyclohydrolase 1 type 2 homolog n=1 Tax=Pseudopedobacter saltans TaxID=151895 RepID=A0A2W5FB10_9SPHI|nr:MAG: Nif3-like dinuclear metal center hexameric protein [Pseudopedobacter saltans]